MPFVVKAIDLEQTVSGDSEIEDVLGKSTATGNSPYIIEGEGSNNVENAKSNGDDYMFNHGVKEVTEKITPKKVQLIKIH
jgi:hypothetical protein